MRAPLLSLVVGQSLRPVITAERREDLVAVRDLIEDGALTPVVDRTFALPEAGDAIRYLERGHAAGKVVVTV